MDSLTRLGWALLEFWKPWPSPSLDNMRLGASEDKSEESPLMIQFFTWDSDVDEGSWWQHFRKEIPNLSALGFTLVWLPPPNKAMERSGRGYDAYDLWDLGEFNQKGTIPTRWGSKDELLEACSTAKSHGIGVLIDAVLGHKLGADRAETFMAIPVEADNRLKKKGPPREIEGWTAYDFPGRNNKYSSLKWTHRHFTGVDWDGKTRQSDIYYIEDPSRKGWSKYVDKELGNYDYLLGGDVDHTQPDVKSDLFDWGNWVLQTTGAVGFRLDAIKHMDRRFLLEFLRKARSSHGNIFAVAEYWSGEFHKISPYIRFFEGVMSFFDVPLHNNFYAASQNEDNDLRLIFKDTLLKKRPGDAVTFVDNHDTQIGQALESWVTPNFKTHAYAIILLRNEGLPCVFYGDLYPNDECYVEETALELKQLILARKKVVRGDLIDYFRYRNCIGFVRSGAAGRRGCAIILRSNVQRTKCVDHFSEYGDSIRMNIDEGIYQDILGDSREVTVGNDCYAVFPCRPGKVAVWVHSEDRKKYFS